MGWTKPAPSNGNTRGQKQRLDVRQVKPPIDSRDLHRRIRGMIEEAEGFLAKLPSDAVGVVFMDGDKPVQSDLNALDRYHRNAGAPSGLWPTSPDITHAMLERYSKPKP